MSGPADAVTTTRSAAVPRRAGRDSRSYLTAFVLQGLGAASAYASQVVLARWMDAPMFGRVSQIIAYVTILSLIATFGSVGSSMRHIPPAHATGERQYVAQFMGFSLQVTTIGSAVCAAVVAIALRGELAAGSWLVTLYIAVFLWATALLTTGTGLGRSVNRYVSTYGAMIVIRPVGICLLAGLAIGLHIGSTLERAVGVLMVSALVALIVQFTQLRSFGRGHWLRRAPSFTTWLRSSPVFLLAGGLSLLLNQVDLLAVSVVLSKTDLAIYSAASKTAQVVILAQIAVANILAPRISTNAGLGRFQELVSAVRTGTIWTFTLALVVGLPLLVLAPLVLHAFGGQYVDGAASLRYLVLGIIINVSFGQVGSVLIYSDHRRAAVTGSFVSVVFGAAICLIGAQYAGLAGAAAASGLSSVFTAIVLYVLSSRLAGVRASIVDTLLRRPSRPPLARYRGRHTES